MWGQTPPLGTDLLSPLRVAPPRGPRGGGGAAVPLQGSVWELPCQAQREQPRGLHGVRQGMDRLWLKALWGLDVLSWGPGAIHTWVLLEGRWAASWTQGLGAGGRRAGKVVRVGRGAGRPLGGKELFREAFGEASLSQGLRRTLSCPVRGLGTGRASGAVTVLPEPGGAAPVPAGLPGPHVRVVSSGPASMCLSARMCVFVCSCVCVCLCVFICVRMFGCTHVRVHVCMFVCRVFMCVVVCLCVHVCLGTHVFMCAHVFMSVCRVFMCSCVCVYACVCVCLCVSVHVCECTCLHPEGWRLLSTGSGHDCSKAEGAGSCTCLPQASFLQVSGTGVQGDSGEPVPALAPSLPSWLLPWAEPVPPASVSPLQGPASTGKEAWSGEATRPLLAEDQAATWWPPTPAAPACLLQAPGWARARKVGRAALGPGWGRCLDPKVCVCLTEPSAPSVWVSPPHLARPWPPASPELPFAWAR